MNLFHFQNIYIQKSFSKVLKDHITVAPSNFFFITFIMFYTSRSHGIAAPLSPLETVTKSKSAFQKQMVSNWANMIVLYLH